MKQTKKKKKLKEEKYILKKVNNKMLRIKLSSADDTNKNYLKNLRYRIEISH